MAAKNRITVNLSDGEYAALAELAERHQVSLAWLCRRAVGLLIEKYGSNAGGQQMAIPFFEEPPKEGHA